MDTTMIKNEVLEYNVDQDGVAIISINMVNAPTNLFSFPFIKTYLEIAQKAVEDEQVKGLIITSGHRDFMAGADLRMLLSPPEDKQAFLDDILLMHQQFRNLETCGKPFVAAINGTALGGGYELALTCHKRFALNNPKLKIGLPEVQLGLFPGGGGTQRLTRLIGIAPALTNILQARQFRPAAALEENYVDALYDTNEELLAAAKTWILENPKVAQAWDQRGHKVPGGGLMSKNGVQTMAGAIGNLRKKTHGNYPGAQYAMAAIHDGIELPIDRALEIEARYFVGAVYSPEAKNMIRTGFFFMNEAKKGKARPKDQAFYPVKKIGILGAGMMGAGIAYVSAKRGMDVVLKDISIEGAEKGKAYSQKILAKQQSKGRLNAEQVQATLDKIKTTVEASDLEGCDLVIEAVFENQALKAKVTAETEAVLAENKIYASNTSTIPITLLAQASKRPENFIGIHFFSPVDKMPLVEIIVGEKTSDYAIAAAVDYVTQIGKVPIVVNDSRGFFTSRVFGVYTGEGALLLEEGVPPVMIDNIAKRVGMPVGPLAVTDEVALSLCLHVMDAAGEDKWSDAEKRIYAVYAKMVRELGREGKKVGKGFYDYPENAKKHMWKGLEELFPSNVDYLDGETVGKRLLHRMALESYRCLDESVLRTTKDGDLGSLLGFGFPPYTGGVFAYIDYVGLDKFIVECDDFANRFGARFAVPDSLRQRAKDGKTFY
ncbi:MAG: 3-hydroxyacyl-CoA dehydrogenase NAD-binding domain-containing protein [Saprospiraceae bacterium]|nr:3-hydroxyacyl-CoA dehydrogenase NAD-binding domain-containing protein [Saprospiraceae bacterium]